MATEIWISIKGYEDRYEVSDLGRVRSLSFTKPCEEFNGGVYVKTGKLLSPMMDRKGHVYVALKRDGKTKRTRVKNLVAEAFNIEIKKGQYLYCIDSDPYNCAKSNLVAAYRGQCIQDVILSDGKFTCDTCESRKGSTEFYSDKSVSFGKQTTCTECIKLAVNDRYYKVKDTAQFKQYQKKYAPKSAAMCAARKAILKRTSTWGNYSELKPEIEKFYKVAHETTQTTGVEHQVDHIVPLKAVDPNNRKIRACGLHVPWNLQVITAEENNKKKNKLVGV